MHNGLALPFFYLYACAQPIHLGRGPVETGSLRGNESHGSAIPRRAEPLALAAILGPSCVYNGSYVQIVRFGHVGKTEMTTSKPYPTWDMSGPGRDPQLTAYPAGVVRNQIPSEGRQVEVQEDHHRMKQHL